MADERAAFQRVRVAAYGALLLVVAGIAVGLPDHPERMDARTTAALAVVAAGLLLAIGCLWHCARHAHERGRGTAGLAAVLGVFGVLVLSEPWVSTVRSGFF